MPNIKELNCTFCSDQTLWPEENEVQMEAYGIMHIINDCQEAPVIVRAEAIMMVEEMNIGETQDGV